MPLKLSQLDFNIDKTILTRRLLHLRIGPMDVQAAMHEASAKLRKDVDVPGFRQGKAPIIQVLKHHRSRVKAQALATLRQSALDEILPKLSQADQPLTPPKQHGKPPRLRLGQGCVITVSYLVDPAGITRNPENPQADQGTVVSGNQALSSMQQPMGVPGGPQLPQTPGMPGLPGHPIQSVQQDSLRNVDSGAGWEEG